MVTDNFEIKVSDFVDLFLHHGIRQNGLSENPYLCGFRKCPYLITVNYNVAK